MFCGSRVTWTPGVRPNELRLNTPKKLLLARSSAGNPRRNSSYVDPVTIAKDMSLRKPFKELLKDIHSSASVIESYLTANDLPDPCIRPGGPVDFFPASLLVDVAAAHEKLQGASKELHELAIGPQKYVIGKANEAGVLFVLSLQHTFDR